jgi:hypothetical protein
MLNRSRLRTCIVALIAALALAFLAPGTANAAACFWVGGTGSINDTTKWSNASGGSPSTCAAAGGWPNSTADTATLNASSGGGTITRNVGWTVASITVDAFTGTFGNSTDSAAVQLDTWNNSGSGTRTVNLGTSIWTCGRAGITACNWLQTGATNLTFNANSSTVAFAGSLNGSYQILNLGSAGTTYNIVTFSPDQPTGRGSILNTGTNTIGTLNIGSPNVITNTNTTWTVTTLNWTGGIPGFSSWSFLYVSQVGQVWTIALTNASTCTYCIFREMAVTGSTITGTSAIDLGRLSGFSLTPPSAGGGCGGRIIGG